MICERASLDRSIVHARAHLLDKFLPVARLVKNALNLSLTIVVVKKHFVEERVRHLHVHQELVVLVSVRLHALVPLLKLVVLTAQLFRRVLDADFDWAVLPLPLKLLILVLLVRTALVACNVAVVVQLAFENVHGWLLGFLLPPQVNHLVKFVKLIVLRIAVITLKKSACVEALLHALFDVLGLSNVESVLT